MKKQLLIITAAVLIFALCFAACGPSSSAGSVSDSSPAASGTASAAGSSEASGGPGASDAAGSTVSDTPAREEPSSASVPGETVDTGLFRILIPEGWMGAPQTDVFGDKDEDGNYPLNPKSFGIIKGGESEWDAFSKPTIYVYLNEGNAEEDSEWNIVFYEKTEPIDMSVNGKKAVAYEVWTSAPDDDDPGYTYHIVFLQVDDGHYFQFNIPIDMNGEPGVSSSDADVVAVMESAVLD